MIRTMSTLAVLATAGAASAQSTAILLEVDLSVADEVTITATSGASAATISGSDTTGIWLDGLLDGTAGETVFNTGGTGDLTSAANGSDGTPGSFTNDPGETGLNVWSYTTDPTSDFTAGETAFSGSATWSVSADVYGSFAAEGSTGFIYFPADNLGDLSTATILGQWVIVPAPGAGALLAMGGRVAVRRRRA